MPVPADANEKVPVAIAQFTEYEQNAARSLFSGEYSIAVLTMVHAPASTFTVVETTTSSPLSEIAAVPVTSLLDSDDYIAPLRIDSYYQAKAFSVELPLMPWDE